VGLDLCCYRGLVTMDCFLVRVTDNSKEVGKDGFLFREVLPMVGKDFALAGLHLPPIFLMSAT
jgi:hypothetical protein